MFHQGVEIRVGNPIVRVGGMEGQAHVVAPVAREFSRWRTTRNQHTAVNVAPFLSEKLRGKCAQRKTDGDGGARVAAHLADGDVLDGIVAECARVQDALVNAREGAPTVVVGCMDHVARRFEARAQQAQALGEAIRVMEQRNLGHVFSVRFLRTLRYSSGVPRRGGYAGFMSRSRRARWGAATSPSGVVLVAVQALLFAGIGLWPSSWGPASAALREVGGVLFVLGAAGMLASALHLGAALTPVPEPNGKGLRTRGLYRWMRHPMYASILVVVIGVGAARGSWVVWGLVVALAVFFELKTRREEAYLMEAYPGYSAYAAATGKFVPGLGTRRPPQ